MGVLHKILRHLSLFFRCCPKCLFEETILQQNSGEEAVCQNDTDEGIAAFAPASFRGAFALQLPFISDAMHHDPVLAWEQILSGKR